MSAPDLAGYRLYRGSSASFQPGPTNLLSALTTTAFNDPAGMPFYYRITAIDVHGNESPSALLLPSGTLGVDGSQWRPALAPPVPNPARGSTTLAYAVPREEVVRLALYDVDGRLVRMLFDGVEPAGEHVVTWDLRDQAGRAVGAGLYLARFEAAGRVITRRVMAIR